MRKNHLKSSFQKGRLNVLSMTRTEILCPQCLKKKLLKESETDAYCDECGTAFNIVGPNTVKFKSEPGTMEERHPGYSKESYNTGKFLGSDFPYVPGDPFW
jgi:hypothetical protein